MASTDLCGRQPRWIEQRPAPAALPGFRKLWPLLVPAPLGIDQRAQVLEAVGGDHVRLQPAPTARSQSPLSACRFRARCRQRRTRHAAAKIQARSRALDSDTRSGFSLVALRRGCIQSASSRTKNVIGATLVGTTRRRPSPRIFQRCRMRRQAAPANCSGQAKLIERRRDRSRSRARPGCASPTHSLGSRNLAIGERLPAIRVRR